MIVPMKKISILCLAHESESAISKLRGLGVLHVEHSQEPRGEDITALSEEISLAREALAILSEKEFSDNQCKGDYSVQKDWHSVARRIIADKKRYDQLKDYSRILQGMIVQWQEWGDFDPSRIEELASKNIFVRLYSIPEKELKKVPEGLVVEVISKSAGSVNCCVISREKIDLPFKEITPPKTSLTDMGVRFMEDKKTILDIQKDIKKLSCYKWSFLDIQKALEKELEFHETVKGMGSAGELAYVSGFIPFDSESMLLETAKKEKWAVLVTDPSPDEIIPTLIRNPKWVSIIQPVLKFLEVLPGYTELDTSPVFLIFFSLFFGIIIGDAGYGFLYFLLTFIAHKKIGKDMQDQRIFSLMYVLSSCAIVWGVLTGTYFGQAWLAHTSIKALVPALNDPVIMQGVCFFIGVVHLSLAHFWRFLIQLPSRTAWADFGWIIILWAAYLLVKMLLLGAVFPFFRKYMIITGISLVVLFSSPRKTFLRTIGAGLGNIALSLMNSFGDIVSYVRLFAVGLAGVAISDAFTAMAAGARGDSTVGLIGAAAILIAGHLLNFVLSPMSVLVHGIRLNVLEFSGHAGVSWSGTAYRPLKK